MPSAAHRKKSNKMDKILSIIVPSCNMEAYLPKCLNSLVVDDEDLLQKLDVIVVNDGSKDRTSEIAHEFEAKYPGVFRVIDKPNGHYGSCINAALPVAKGTFVKVLDADDWYITDNFRDYLAFVNVQCLQADSAPDLILNDWEEGDETGRNAHRITFSYLDSPNKTLADIEFKNGHRFEMFAVAYRTDNLRSMGYSQPEGTTHTDKIWIHSPMATVRRFAVFDKVVYHYYVSRPGNTCNAVEYYRTYHVQMEMLKRMIAQYNEIKDDLNLPADTFFRNHLRYRAGRAYIVHLVDSSPLLLAGALKDLDDFLQEHTKWLYDELDRATLPYGMHYHYIRDWRKHQCMSAMMKLRLGLVKFLSSKYWRLARSCERVRVLTWHGLVLGVKGVLPRGLYGHVRGAWRKWQGGGAA